MTSRAYFVLIAIYAIAGCSSSGGTQQSESSDRPEFAEEVNQPVRECRRPVAAGAVRGSGATGTGQVGGAAVSPVTDCDIDDASRSAIAQANAVNRETNEQEQQTADTSQRQREAGQEQLDQIGYPQPHMPMGGMRRF